MIPWSCCFIQGQTVPDTVDREKSTRIMPPQKHAKSTACPMLSKLLLFGHDVYACLRRFGQARHTIIISCQTRSSLPRCIESFVWTVISFVFIMPNT